MFDDEPHVTRTVTSVGAPTVDDLVAAADAATGDLVELRLDLLDDLASGTVDVLASRLTWFHDRAIVTVRAPWEGGAYDGGDAARLDILLAAVDARPFAVDVEAASNARLGVLDAAFAGDVRVVLSRHHLDATPAAADLVAHLREAREAGAWVGKVATRVTGPDDAATLLEAAIAARDQGLRYALMAVNDPFLRLLAPALGQALVYVRADGASSSTSADVPVNEDAAPTAPGQVRARDVRRLGAKVVPRTTAAATPVFLLGDPVAHSLSPAMQNAAFQATGVDAVYLARRVPAARLGDAVRGLAALDALGANVTVPHKVAVMDHVAHLAKDAEVAGAVNTLVLRDGAVEGHNTDVAGALAALDEAGVRLKAARVLLLGAGGAARAVLAGLLRRGARVALANRSAERADALAKDFPVDVLPWKPDALVRTAHRADLVVNATSVGLHGKNLPLPPEALTASTPVMDLVYRPGGTPLAQAAARRGATVIRGERMLLHQGAAAFTLWTGRPAPLAVMDRALAAEVNG